MRNAERKGPVAAPMPGLDSLVSRKRLRAPSEHGDAWIDPPLAEVLQRWPVSDAQPARQKVAILGSPLGDLAERAREELRQRALAHSTVYLPEAAAPPQPRIVMAGHQPRLFHPGVWFKNFLLSRVAAAHHALPVNLVIDNDVADTVAIRVPTGSPEQPRMESVLFDQATAIMPFEERTILDRETFERFGIEVAARIAPFVDDPIVNRLWPLAVEAAKRGSSLGQAIASARHQLEWQLGVRNLEVPLSSICDSHPFRVFMLHILGNLERFREIHNRSLHVYRRLHKIRSRSHPVPELASESGWLEAPFWVWDTRNPTRRQLFARVLERGIELTDRRDWTARIATTDDFAEIRAGGVKLRSRALTTTMYARLLLCDLFVHGIGGAKYDQLTDAIVSEFFGCAAPGYLTVSATAKILPDKSAQIHEKLRQTIDTQRSLEFHPEKHVNWSALEHDKAARVRELVREKARVLEAEPSNGKAKSRHDAIVAINRELQSCLKQTQQILEERQRQLAIEFRRQSQLASRDFSFCLFSFQSLPALLLELLEKDA